jgi:hypothetical protein
VVSENFEFLSTRNETRVITRSLADFQSVRSFFDSQRLSYFTFCPKSDKPIEAVIRHLPLNTPAEDISDGLVELGFDVVSVKQMTTTRRSSPEDPKIINLHLFLVTLPKTAESQEIFLPSLCHIAIKVEAYRAQNGLTQCHNCQQFGHVWAICKQLPRCLWCGGGHVHKKCPEKENAYSTLTCCKCRLAEGENLLPVLLPLLSSYPLLVCFVDDVLHLSSHLHLFASFGRQQALDRRTYICMLEWCTR